MPVWEWILIAASVVVVVAVVIVAASVVRSRKKTERLKQHYGREYERLVSETRDQKSASSSNGYSRCNAREAPDLPVPPAHVRP